MRRTLWAVTFGLSLSLPSAVGSAPADTNTNQDESTAFESRALAILDVVLNNHIDPPTRQQMILSGVKAFYRAEDRTAPKGLSERVSALGDADQMARYLRAVCEEFGVLTDAESVLVKGMLEAVPGGAFLIDADVAKVNEQLAANRYVGIGIALMMREEEKLPAISRVFFDGPAWKAGVRDGDLIVEIDGAATVAKDLNEVVQQLRGAEGVDVTVVVRQPDSAESRTLTVTRGRTFIPTVEGHHQISEGTWRYTTDSAKDIALIRINSTGPSTLHELRQVEAKLRRETIRGIVLDLREGGGILHDVVMVADGLLDGGIIGHVRSLDSVQTYEARPGALFQNLPMAVLIAKGAAADRVFLTAALQDRGRAIVVGEPTSGETYVNGIVPIPGRDEKIRLAIGVMQRGDGTPLLATGSIGLPGESSQVAPGVGTPHEENKRPGIIVPDHLISVTTYHAERAAPDSEPATEDPMLAKAIEVLRDIANDEKDEKTPGVVF